MKPRRWLLGIGCFVASLVLIDLGLSWFGLADGEFLGRPVPPYGDVREARWRTRAERQRQAILSHAEPPETTVTDALLGWTNVKNFRSKDGTQSTNSKGLRGTREFDEFPPSSALRVALFGESFVFGEEVPDGDDFAAQLGAMDAGLEVLNFGVSGFGTDQALMRLRSEGTNCHSQVMCIGLMLENIVRNVSRFTRLRNPYVKSLGVKPRFLLEHGALVPVPSPYASELELCDAVLAGTLPEQVREHDAFAEMPYENWIWKSSFARLYLAWQGSEARDYRRAWLDESGEAFQVTLAILAAFDAEARAAGAQRTLVIVFPPKEDLALALSGQTRFWKGLGRELDRRHVASLDLTDALAAKAKALAGAESSPTAIANHVFLRAHLDRAGNEVVARALLEWLRLR